MVHVADVVNVLVEFGGHGLSLRSQKLLTLRTLMLDCARRSFFSRGDVGGGRTTNLISSLDIILGRNAMLAPFCANDFRTGI